MKESNLSARPNYTHVSDDNLKVYMAGVLNKNPRFGLQMFKGYLVSQNVLLKQERLRSCYQDVRISENAPMNYWIHQRVSILYLLLNLMSKSLEARKMYPSKNRSLRITSKA
uniref:Uncharacterized protein n=1 Tax=Daphnia galeata TaxID=27404 RepID=A0A8J2RJG3_9CRUS|nr:unnamed protein product [Daphnia galeata]